MERHTFLRHRSYFSQLDLLIIYDNHIWFSFENFGVILIQIRISAKSILPSTTEPNHRIKIIQITEKYPSKLPNMNKKYYLCSVFL